MSTQEENRKITLDHMVEEKFAEIFFIAKEEYDIASNSIEEKKLYNLLDVFKSTLKRKCKEHFSTRDLNEKSD